MGISLKKVLPGDTLNIPAETFNTFIDTAQAFRDQKQSLASASQLAPPSSGIITVRNNTDEDQDRFAVLCITGIVVPPEDNEPEFKNSTAFEADEPGADNLGKCVILTEPIATGRFGQAMIAGLTPVHIDVLSEDHEYAVAKSETTSHLESAASGPFRALWKEPGTGVKWAIVQLPVGGGGQPFLARLVKKCQETLTGDKLAKFAYVKKATGTINDSEIANDEQILVQILKEGWHQEGDTVIVAPLEGGDPPWVIVDMISGVNSVVAGPTAPEMADDQWTPTIKSTCVDELPEEEEE